MEGFLWELEIDIEVDTRKSFLFYERDRLKYIGGISPKYIEIYYPYGLRNGIRNSYIYPVDKLRHYLSILLRKLKNTPIDRIVLKPYYVTNGEIELVSMFFPSIKTLSLYMSTSYEREFEYIDRNLKVDYMLLSILKSLKELSKKEEKNHKFFSIKKEIPREDLEMLETITEIYYTYGREIL